ncbi:MAG: HAMP domain-containing histidine kinase, partial [Chryseobacterium sp.]
DETFKVTFFSDIFGHRTIVADPRTMLFDRAIAEIEGYVDGSGDGFYGVKSSSLDIHDYAMPILSNKSLNGKFSYLRNVHFKAFYFIYNRTEYYSNISKLELRNIQTLAKEYGGIRLYRNGFRVLPYGEEKDDWLGLDIRYAGDSSYTNIPFANKNLFGFVELIDPEGKNFQETASREGLILNDALGELQDFVQSSLVAARGRIAEGITLVRRNRVRNSTGGGANDSDKIQDDFKRLEDFVNSEEPNPDKAEAQKLIGNLKVSYDHLIEELGMLRVLAGLGLTIAEFTHEVIQFTPSINGYITALKERNANDLQTMQVLENLTSVFNNFTAYTSYFNATVSQNVSRELKPIRLIDVVNSFSKTITDDLKKTNITFNIAIYDYELLTVPMHASEWSSILFNFYTNAKKAIKRAGSEGQIEIILGVDKEFIYLEFMDNGDGVAEEDKNRIFNAFYTTSTPVGYDAPTEDKLTGTGLGLKIVKDIIETYKGAVYLIPAEQGFSTCFRIDIPMANEKQKSDYGL